MVIFLADALQELLVDFLRLLPVVVPAVIFGVGLVDGLSFELDNCFDCAGFCSAFILLVLWAGVYHVH